MNAKAEEFGYGSFVLGIVVTAFTLTVLVYPIVITKKSAVEEGHAHYDPITREFTWNNICTNNVNKN